MMKIFAASLLALSLAACTADRYGDPYDPYSPPPTQAGQTPTMEPYRATGTEPFWSLDITAQELRFKTAEGFAATDRNYDFRPDRRNGDVYQGQRIRATVVARECSDGMSSRTYPHTVVVEIASQVWRGCGAPARAFGSNNWESGPPPSQPGYTSDYGNDMIESFANSEWRIVSINGRPTDPDGDYSLAFLSNSVRATFGCNHFNGSYDFSGQTITTGRMAATRKACQDDWAERVGEAMLSQPLNVQRNGLQVTLSNSRGTLTAVRTY